MQHTHRPAPFVLISTNHGTMIINRNDYVMTDKRAGYGVGYQLMETSSFDHEEVNLALTILQARKNYFGTGVVALDCGANIGVHTIEWGQLMTGWGNVHSFEAQERVFYALAGNVAINNCLNVSAHYAAVGKDIGIIQIPEPNYLIPSSYGSFELRSGPKTEFIGQIIDYNATKKTVPVISIDSMSLPRVDFIKIDVEGMEEEVLAGATNTIARSKPIMLIETIKSNAANLQSFVDGHGYIRYALGINMLAVHSSDPFTKHLKIENDALHIL